MKKLFPIFLILYIVFTAVGCFHNDEEDGDAAFMSVLGHMASGRWINMPDPMLQLQTTKMENDNIFIKGTVMPNQSSLEDRAYLYQSPNQFSEVKFSGSRADLGNGRQLFSQTLVSGPGGSVVPSGSVLIIGGFTSQGITDTAEFYHPHEKVILPLGKLKIARASHTVTEIKNSGTSLDGQFLVVGGRRTSGSALVAAVELFDPMTGTFTTLNAQLKIPREQHTATLLADGRILIAGGQTANGTTDRGEIFDPATRTFTLVPNAMSDARVFHTATYLNNKTPSDSTDDAVLIVGGQDSSGFANDSADFYNPVTGLFQPVGSVTQEPIYQHRAATLPVNSPHDAVLTGGMTKMPTFGNNSEVILSITNQVEVFDYTHTPSGPDGFFTKTRDMLAKRAMHSTDSIGTNTLVILGGVNESGVAHTQGEEYDF